MPLGARVARLRERPFGHMLLHGEWRVRGIPAVCCGITLHDCALCCMDIALWLWDLVGFGVIVFCVRDLLAVLL